MSQLLFRAYIFICCGFTQLIAEEPAPNTTLVWGGQTWINHSAPKEAKQPYLEPQTNHLTLQAPAGTRAKQLTSIFQIAIQGEIKNITLSTGNPTDRQATFQLADIGKFLDAQKDHEFTTPLDWGFHYMLSNSALGLLFENRDINFALEVPVNRQLLELNLKSILESKNSRLNKEQLFLACHQKTTFTELINIISASTHNGLTRILPMVSDDLVRFMQIQVKQDPRIAPPKAGVDAKNQPMLTITLQKNGQFKYQGKPITEEQLIVLCKQHINKHPNGKLQLAGQQGVKFKHIQKIINTAKQGGIDNVVFSVEVPEPDKNSKIIEQELKMSLPETAPDGPPSILAPMFLSIDKAGIISINQGAAKEQLDLAPKQGKLPLLRECLELFVATAKASGQEPVVQISVDKKAQKQRLIDVLNALAAVKITKVTFVDVINE